MSLLHFLSIFDKVTYYAHIEMNICSVKGATNARLIDLSTQSALRLFNFGGQLVTVCWFDNLLTRFDRRTTYVHKPSKCKCESRSEQGLSQLNFQEVTDVKLILEYQKGNLRKAFHKY